MGGSLSVFYCLGLSHQNSTRSFLPQSLDHMLGSLSSRSDTLFLKLDERGTCAESC